jgi:hypothetical protein
MTIYIQSDRLTKITGDNVAVYLDTNTLKAASAKIAAIGPNIIAGKVEADDVMRVLCEALDVWPQSVMLDVIVNGS